MDKCFTLVFITVFVASVIHGFTVGSRHGNRNFDMKVAMENITGAGEYSLSKHSLRIAEMAGNSTLEFFLLRNGTNPAVTSAMAGCIKALKLSTRQVEAAAAAFESSDVTTQGQAFDDLRAQMGAALQISRTCVNDCFVELSSDDSQVAHQLHLACTSHMVSHSQVWMDAEELCLQFLDLEFNRIQLASWWQRSSNSSSQDSEPM